MLRYLLMSNGKATKRLNALANSFKVPLRQLCSGMNSKLIHKGPTKSLRLQ